MAGRLGVALLLEPVLRSTTHLRIDIGLFYVVWGIFFLLTTYINQPCSSFTVRHRTAPWESNRLHCRIGRQFSVIPLPSLRTKSVGSWWAVMIAGSLSACSALFCYSALLITYEAMTSGSNSGRLGLCSSAQQSVNLENRPFPFQPEAWLQQSVGAHSSCLLYAPLLKQACTQQLFPWPSISPLFLLRPSSRLFAGRGPRLLVGNQKPQSLRGGPVRVATSTWLGLADSSQQTPSSSQS